MSAPSGFVIAAAALGSIVGGTLGTHIWPVIERYNLDAEMPIKTSNNPPDGPIAPEDDLEELHATLIPGARSE